VRGVSNLPKELVQALVLTGMSKGQVSEMAKELDKVAASPRNRLLDQALYTCFWLDAISQRCLEGGGIVNVAPVIATAVIVQVKREVLGLDVATNEDSAGGKAFLRSLVVRALRGRRG
jgi:transposase-like protein